MRSSFFSFIAAISVVSASTLAGRATTPSNACQNETVVHHETLENGVVVKGVVCNDDVKSARCDENGLEKRDVSYVCPSCTFLPNPLLFPPSVSETKTKC